MFIINDISSLNDKKGNFRPSRWASKTCKDGVVFKSKDVLLAPGVDKIRDLGFWDFKVSIIRI